MAASQYWQHQKHILENRIRQLVNDDLKALCKAYGYQVSGVKSVLQKRCLEVLNDEIRTGTEASLNLLKYRIDNHGRSPPQGYPNDYGSYSQQSSYSNSNMGPQRGGGALPAPSSDKYFKSSPFYEILETLVPLQELRDMPQNRHTVPVTLTIKPQIAELFRKDNLKIEVKVNDSEVKSNFKGLKNKPGSTKPADLTPFIKKYKSEPNTIQVTYALTTRKFAFLVYLVRNFTPAQLTDRVKRHSVIRKQKVLDAMSRANADPDIAATSIRMSLKDPISTLRITVPIRSSNCQHNQCFDGVMFMQLQEQAPQWSCPICTRAIPFESLCVDEYFQEILDKTPATTEKVDIEPNGQWKVIKDEDDDSDQANFASNKRGRAAYDDDFEDLVELDQPDNKRVNGIKRESFHSQSSPMGGAPINLSTPPVPSRETSASHSGSKRPQSAVIDLTLSDDDEDDEPPRPAKRQHVHRPSYPSTNQQRNRQTSFGTPNSIPDTSRYSAQNRTQPPQDNAFRPTNTHNPPPRPSFNAPSMSPSYQPSPPMQNQPNWTPSPLTSNFPRHSSTPSYPSIPNNSANSPMYQPASPVAHRPPPPPPAPHVHRDPPPRDSFYPPNPNHNPGYNTHNNQSSWTPRPGQGPQGGLRLPPLSSSTQNPYQNGGGWRSDGFDYGGGNWPQSPHG